MSQRNPSNTRDQDLLENIGDELKMIRMYLCSPAYIVRDPENQRGAFKEIREAFSKPLGPGQIIPLSNEAFALYKTMIPCPPRSP